MNFWLNACTTPLARSMRRIVFVLTALLVHTAAQAFVYTDDTSGYSIEIAGPWIPPPGKKMSPTESTLRCAPATCGHDVLLNFSSYYDASLKNGKIGDFLKYTNSKTLTQDLSAARTRFKIAGEGRTRVGQLQAYEVVAKVTHSSGQPYMRHTFMTFKAGHFYTIHLISPISAHDKALQAAQPVLDSFVVK